MLAALEANFVTHASWILGRLEGARVEDSASYVLVDSGLATDTFNLVCRARLDAEDGAERARRAVAFFEDFGRPFSWWVGPIDEPERLGEILAGIGLVEAESETAMAVSLADLETRETPSGLRIERASTAGHLADFGRVCAANWDPPDAEVERFYGSAAAVLAPDSPIRLYVGYVGGEPVACSELCLGGGVAGLYGVSTLAAHRRRGYGNALTQAPLLDARAAGVRAAVLQASPDGEPVYARMGFRPIGRYTEYKPGLR
jgi:ribosomal protein S18 acetylase RimI-like enzyme